MGRPRLPTASGLIGTAPPSPAQRRHGLAFPENWTEHATWVPPTCATLDAVSGQRKAILGVVAAPLVLIALLSAVWAIDAWATSDRVGRNVVVAGTPVGGQSRDELTDTVESLAAEFPATEVVVDVAEFRLDTVAADLGLGLDVDATVDAAFEVGRDDPLPTRPVRWLRAWFSERDVDARLDLDPEPLTSSLAALEGDRRTPPVDPVLEATEEAVSVVPGIPGRAITVNDVVAALPTRVASLDGPLEISVEQTTTEPSISDEEVQALADRANAATDGPITLLTGSGEVEVDGSRFRPGLHDGDRGRLGAAALDGARPRRGDRRRVGHDTAEPDRGPLRHPRRGADTGGRRGRPGVLR